MVVMGQKTAPMQHAPIIGSPPSMLLPTRPPANHAGPATSSAKGIRSDRQGIHQPITGAKRQTARTSIIHNSQIDLPAVLCLPSNDSAFGLDRASGADRLAA